LVVYPDHGPDDIGTAAESLLPDAMTENDDRRCIREDVGLTEPSSKLRRRADHADQRWGQRRAGKRDAFIANPDDATGTAVTADCRDGPRTRDPAVVRPMAQPPISGQRVAAGLFFPQSHEALWLDEGKRPQQDAVEQRVHGGCRTDRERQGRHRRGGEARVAAERGQRLAEIRHLSIAS
jgi:hypothetical protein